MRRILFSLLTIGLVSAVVIGGTMAFFRDKEVSTGNVFEAGTIDVAVDGVNPWSQSFEWEDVKPGKDFSIDYNVTNVGQNPLKLWQIIKCRVTDENGIIEPEQAWYDEHNGGLPKNDIDDAIIFEMYVDDMMVIDRQDDISLRQVEDRYIALRKLDPNDNSDFDGILEPGESVVVRHYYKMRDDTGNWAQSDKLSFVLEVEARQVSAPEPLLQLATYDNKFPGWQATADGRLALLKYDYQAPDFNYDLFATGLDTNIEYCLLYIKDPWNEDKVLIEKAMTDGDGKLNMVGNSHLGDLPAATDANFGIGAKIWIIPCSDYNESGQSVGWPPNSSWLFDNWPGLINYREGIRPNEVLNCDYGENTTEPGCGDGVWDPATEECDNGTANIDNQEPIWALTEADAFRQYCSTDCEIYEVPGMWCGDGNVDNPYEACDDGNNIDGDGCEADCTLPPTPTCADDDGDGYGVGPDRSACTYPDEDCDDGNLSVNPGAAEVCDGVDNDCDGEIDEGVVNVYYYDSDGDGYGEDGLSVESCNPVTGYAELGGDCNDGDPAINPGAAEVCDGVDNDCDAQIDEDWPELGQSCSVGLGICEAGGVYVCNAQNPAGNSVCDAVPGTPETENCSDSLDNDCDGLVSCFDDDCASDPVCMAPPDVDPGDVIIDEILKNPAVVADTDGEWFEVYNPTNSPVDLQGCVISDNGSDTHTIASSLVVPSTGYAVLGRNVDSGVNGGAAVDYSYGSDITLANTEDEIIITCGGTEIDRVDYTTDFPSTAGVSMILSDLTADNNVAANWCESTAAFGDGDKGSPGSINDPCGAVLIHFDQDPYTVVSGETFTARVLTEDVTDLWGFGFRLYYDPTLLEYVGNSTMTSILNSPTCPLFVLPQFGPDYVVLGGTPMGGGCGPVSGSGELISVTFRAKAATGISSLRFTNTSFSGFPPGPIPAAWQDGKVLVTEQQSVTLNDVGASDQFGYDLDYSQAAANLSFSTPAIGHIGGDFVATGLKPYATYQLKFEGRPLCVDPAGDDAQNEIIGSLGRYWDLTTGENVSESDYYADSVYHGGTHCIVGYIVWGYVTADASGAVSKSVAADNSYHVLRCGGGTCGTVNDALLQNLDGTTNPPGFPYCAAADVNGELEPGRPGCGELSMPSGDYSLRLILNEESFHQSTFGTWTAVMDADMNFTIL